MDLLLNIDEATASRINQNCDDEKYVVGIEKDRNKNYRLTNNGTVI